MPLLSSCRSLLLKDLDRGIRVLDLETVKDEDEEAVAFVIWDFTSIVNAAALPLEHKVKMTRVVVIHTTGMEAGTDIIILSMIAKTKT